MNESSKSRLKVLLREALAILDGDGPDDGERQPKLKALPKLDEEELEGVIARPQLQTVKGKLLFTAGLKLENGEWVNLVSWGGTAEVANGIAKGAHARLSGIPKRDYYLDQSGVMRQKNEFVVKRIVSVAAASSAATA